MREYLPERWARIDALFADALDQPADRRDSYLDEATDGDENLKAEVLALLASLDPAEVAIGDSAAAFVGPAGTIGEAPAPEAGYPAGHRIGPYAIVTEIGRGGMGAVYLADRTDGNFPRRVAIKSLRPGPLDQATLGRFRREQAILATLDHPRIARLHDSGIGSDGRPYLVMAHVVGTRIDHWCDQRRASVAERLRLFEQVCDAVDYAHNRLIVHRDLKPGNVLVTDSGDAVLLDFGIAKLLADESGEDPATRAGARILTPEYAAPEQLRGEPVTTAVDVYALGVILFQLLTGRRPPWQATLVARGGAGDLEPLVVRPSAVVLEQDESGTLAAARGSPPGELRRRLRGDLDLITVTALRPSAEARYPSVAALREDVRRYLARRPIQARADSMLYRLRQFVRRSPALATVTGVLLLLGIGFLTTTVAQSRRIAAERDRAEAERDKASRTVELLTGLFESADPFGAVRRDTLRVGAFLGAGVERVSRDLADQPALQAELLTVLSRAHRGLGQFAQARSLAERAVALRRPIGGTDLAASLDAVGVVATHLADHPTAAAAHREALALREAAVPRRAREVAGSLVGLGTAMQELLQYDSADGLYRRALVLQQTELPRDSTLLAAILNNRVNLAFRTGKLDSAAVASRQLVDLTTAQFGPEHPRALLETANLAVTLERSNRFEEAEPLFRRALSGMRAGLGEEHPRTGEIMTQLASALVRRGRWAEAESLAAATVALARKRLGPGHPEVAQGLFLLSQIALNTGRTSESERLDREVFEINRTALGENHPATAISGGRVAGAECRAGRPGAGLRLLAGSVAVAGRTLPPQHEGGLSIRRLYGECLALAGRREAAEQELLAALAVARKHHGDRGRTTGLIAGTLVSLYRRWGRPDRVAELQGLAGGPPGPPVDSPRTK
jgi:serine/threonine-protein kinase